jgi:hypothetical protein
MTDILDTPETITFTLGRKDNLRKLWSTYFNNQHADARDHLHYFAIGAALSLPENQEVCYVNKLRAAFTSVTNPVKLANGHSPFLAGRNLNGTFQAYLSLRRAIADRAAGKPTTSGGFALNSIPLETLARALELLKDTKVLPE